MNRLIDLVCGLPRARVGLLMAVLACAVHPLQAASKRILVLTESRGFTHSVVKRGSDGQCLVEVVLAKIGKSSGLFETVNSQSAIEALKPETLQTFDAVFFYTTGTLIPSGEPRDALLSFVKSGKAFIGAHSATDTFADYPGYFQLINGTFNGHPWGAGTTSGFVTHEPSHTAVKMFPESFQYKDEIYQYKNYDPSAVRVLVSLDMAGSSLKKPYHVPVTWVRDYGQGRLFYTNFGHNESTWNDERFQAHLVAGMRWAFKLDEGPATPNPEVQHLEHARSFLAYHAKALPTDLAVIQNKVVAKSKSDAQFLAKLRARIDACNKLPEPDPKKTDPQQAEALRANIQTAVQEIIKEINR